MWREVFPGSPHGEDIVSCIAVDPIMKIVREFDIWLVLGLTGASWHALEVDRGLHWSQGRRMVVIRCSERYLARALVSSAFQ